MQQYKGVIIHHSACSSINGKGYDYFVTNEADVIPAAAPCDSDYIHVCIEGDYSHFNRDKTPYSLEEQLFAAQKLIVNLYQKNVFIGVELLPHLHDCPGAYFFWSKLVISLQDRYH